MPLYTHSRHLKALQSQLALPQNIQRVIWQTIIIAKLNNQAKCLEFTLSQGVEQLKEIAKCVEIGDSTHMEAKGASLYFKNLYGSQFTRDKTLWINGALNYGYAIIRGMIARSIVAYGYEPSIGICHHSELNSFNLADDLIEPFRPFVDLYVYNMEREGADEDLTPNDKKNIFSMLNCVMEISNKKFNITNAIERMIISFNRCLTNDFNVIECPKLLELEGYRYD